MYAGACGRHFQASSFQCGQNLMPARFYTDRGPTWEAEVYKPTAEFYNEPSFENCRLVKRGEVTALAAEIEQKGFIPDKVAEVVQ